MSRYAGTTTKIYTPMRGVYLHLYWDKNGRLAEASVSHQLKDFDATAAKMFDSLGEWLNFAIQANLLPIVAEGLDDAIKGGPGGDGAKA